MCQVTADNSNDARLAPIPSVTQDKVTNKPEDNNNVPMAYDSSNVCPVNILEGDKKMRHSKMNKIALHYLDIFFREFHKPFKNPPNTCFKNFHSFKDIVTKTYVISSTFCWQVGHVFFQAHMLLPKN